jgi:hypothetical protein
MTTQSIIKLNLSILALKFTQATMKFTILHLGSALVQASALPYTHISISMNGCCSVTNIISC